MSLQLILHYTTIYFTIGVISSWIIDKCIRLAEQEPYTRLEIFLAILFWPLNVLVFIGGIILSFFK